MSKAVYGYVAAVGSITAAVWGLNGMSGEKLREGASIGPVQVGGLSPQAARTRLGQWWAQERGKEFQFTGGGNDVKASLASLNIELDPASSVAAVPRAKLWGSDTTPITIEPVLKFDSAKLEKLKAKLEGTAHSFKPARVVFEKDAIKRTPEEPHLTVDVAALPHAIEQQLGAHGSVTVPVLAGEKRVSDAALASIEEVVASYTTHFSTAKKSRCSNIQLAASKLNGTVLLPGERISFNDVVGRRTQKNGFKIAGVYKNGKHDFDVGGGICQVSTTLYNAALLSNLKVVSRHNHSMPVAYVPLGRDATVDYGVLDLVLENNTKAPIAISSEYVPGRLRFRVLGKKQPGLLVKIETEGRKNWDAGMKTVLDATLPLGAKKVVEKGTQGHSISTFRLVYQDGKLLAREPLGQSYYKGGQKVIAVSKPEVKVAPAQA